MYQIDYVNLSMLCLASRGKEQVWLAKSNLIYYSTYIKLKSQVINKKFSMGMRNGLVSKDIRKEKCIAYNKVF